MRVNVRVSSVSQRRGKVYTNNPYIAGGVRIATAKHGGKRKKMSLCDKPRSGAHH